jgi:lipopolysaccharide/colanic/teichoic acid biosynthesis glycosyltransferase
VPDSAKLPLPLVGEGGWGDDASPGAKRSGEGERPIPPSLFDLTLALVALVLLSPLLGLIALLVRLDSPGPLLHRALRAGRGGRPFTLYKFRSMVADAAAFGPGITAGGDPRVTRVGTWLRRYKLDELPQLLNVLRGEMSLVGPRPEDPCYVALYTPQQRHVLAVRPGITSPASLRFRSEEQLLAGADWESAYVNTIMPAKLALELDYLSRRTFWSDLVLLCRTALAVFRPKSVPAPTADVAATRHAGSA